MEGKSILPTNLNDIPKFKSDTSKWVYFFANLTEEVWIPLREVFEVDPLREVFEADCRHHLRFQMINDGLTHSSTLFFWKSIPFFYALSRLMHLHSPYLLTKVRLLLKSSHGHPGKT